MPKLPWESAFSANHFLLKLIGSGFKVYGLQPIETTQNIDQFSRCLPKLVGRNGFEPTVHFRHFLYFSSF